MFREGIRRRLDEEPDFHVVGEAASAEEAMDLVPLEDPSIVILDIRLPKMSGIEAARQFRHRWPKLKILVLSGYDFDQYVRALARVGVQGYLLKDSPQDQLIDALREIAGGGVVLPPVIASKVIRSYSAQAGDILDRQGWDLTVREIEVLEMLYEGLRNAEIGTRLSISPRTVEAHVGNIISKLGTRSRTEAVRVAVEKNLIK